MHPVRGQADAHTEPDFGPYCGNWKVENGLYSPGEAKTVYRIEGS